MDKFILHSNYKPTGDQPQAIEELVNGINSGDKEEPFSYTEYLNTLEKLSPLK